MAKRVNAMAARKNLGELLEGVFYRGDEVIVERAGKPMGVIIPIAQYERIERSRAETLAKIEAQWSSMPPTVDLRAAELEIALEAEAVRHGSV
jgi:prevent-host-death family protein